MTNPAQLKNTSLIVLYKSKIMDSPTVTSLLNTNLDGVQLKIIIWNNGPSILEQSDVELFEKECDTKRIAFDIYEDTRNISLSHLYNFCINKNRDSDFFSIFDQDSILSSDFLTNLVQHSSLELICPKVYDISAPEKQRWPINSALVSTLFDGEFELAKIFTVSSGLSLSDSLIFKLIKNYGNVFCENYVFYHVDGEFFARFKELRSIIGYCCGSMLHEESAAIEDNQMPETAKLEYGYVDIIHRIKRKNRNVIQNIYFCFRYAIKRKCTFLSLFKLIKCALTKKHPRAKFRIKSDLVPDYSNDRNT